MLTREQYFPIILAIFFNFPHWIKILMCAIAKEAVKRKSFIDLQLTRFFIVKVVFDV